jgi:ferredoxin
MESKKIVIAVFTGTGNTLVIAEALAEELRKSGRDVSIAAMERAETFVLPEGAALGLAAPVACFSTYPTAWRFIDSLPEGGGREAFFAATMGGAGFGMEGPIRRVVEGKGYKPLGALLVKMPGNYGNKELDEEKNERLEKIARESVKKFTGKLLDGSAVWPSGRPIISRLTASLAHGRKPWDFFYRQFPLAVDPEKCTGCGLCGKLCPEGNVLMDGGKARIGERCQSCQRCAAFCPSGAIRVPGKPAVRYRRMSLEAVSSLLEPPGL